MISIFSLNVKTFRGSAVNDRSIAEHGLVVLAGRLCGKGEMMDHGPWTVRRTFSNTDLGWSRARPAYQCYQCLRIARASHGVIHGNA